MEEAFEPRATCARCLRPASVCYCAHLTTIPTRTRIAFLQHPRERHVAIGTARMASLCLPSSELHVGVRWSGSSALASALGDPERPAALLYPGEGAVDLAEAPPPGPITLIVIDGTWAQTKKVLRLNPELAALPRYSFVPPGKSEYRIRREPDDAFVSAIEALAHVLGALEGDASRFLALLTPFRAMVDTQIDAQARLHAPRIRRARAKSDLPSHVPAALRERADQLVCLFTEANAWAYGTEVRPRNGGSDPGELVRVLACRVGSGELFESVVAPRGPLAPRTPHQIGLSEETLRAGTTLDALRAAWSAFVKDDDVLVTWGHHAIRLMLRTDLPVPRERIDLRRIARARSHAPAGSVASYAEAVGAESVRLATGRGGARLGQIAALARYFGALRTPAPTR